MKYNIINVYAITFFFYIVTFTALVTVVTYKHFPADQTDQSFIIHTKWIRMTFQFAMSFDNST